VAICLLGQTNSEEMSLERLLALNQQMLDRIRTLDATLEIWESEDGGATWTMTRRVRWLKDGPRERTIEWANGIGTASGAFVSTLYWRDQSFSPEETRVLVGWNPEQPPDRAPSPLNRFNGVRGDMSPPSSDDATRGYAPRLFYLAPLQTSLAAAVAGDSNASVRPVTIGEHTCWEVVFDPKLPDAIAYRVTIDPARGHAIVRTELQTTGLSQNRFGRNAISFVEIEQGVHFPTLVRQVYRRDPDTAYIYERRLTGVKVNGPINPSDLTVTFPEDYAVYDHRTGSPSVYIWGTNAPKLTFSPKQFEDSQLWLIARSFFSRKSVASTSACLGAIVALVLLMAAPALLRRALRSRRRA
jgi:hypothetical protein